MKYALIVAVVALGFTAVLFFVQFGHCPHILRRFTGAALHREYVPATDIRFRSTGIVGNGSGPRASKFGESVFKSSDCVEVEEITYLFNSPGDADAQLHDWVESAPRIVSADATALSANKRVVLQLAEKERFVILSRDVYSNPYATHPIILYIRSRSLPHALLFEKQYKAGLIGTHMLRSSPQVANDQYSLLSCK